MFSFQIIQVDVGQGDCTVIIIRHGPLGNSNDPIVRTVVIDCGGGRNGIDEIGNKTSGASLVTVLTEQGVQHIDIMVISHYDRDHFGGITSLLGAAIKNNPKGANLRALFANTIFYDRGEPGNYDSRIRDFSNRANIYINYIKHLEVLCSHYGLNVRRATEFVYWNSNQILNLSISDPKFTTQANARNAHYQFTSRSALLGVDILNANGLPLLHGISLVCITANQTRLDDAGNANPVNLTIGTPGENDFSVTLLFRFGNYSHWLSGELLMGDEFECIGPLRSLCFNGELSSMKVSHHGAHESTHTDFLDALGPKVALISCGPDNSYDHPRPEVLDSFFSRNIKVLLTGWGGDPDYLNDILYNHPFSFNADIQIAGSSLPYRMVRGDIILLSSQEMLQDSNTIMSRFFAQNFLYTWFPWREDGPWDSPLGNNLLRGDSFLLEDGDFDTNFELLDDGSITSYDIQADGRYVRNGDWVFIEYELH